MGLLENTDVMLRVRCSGEDWCGFARVLLLSENAMILEENSRRRMVVNLGNVVEFEIDQPAFNVDANFPYQVIH